MEKESYYRPAEVATTLRCSVATIRKKILRREIGYRKCGRLVLIPQAEVDRLLGEYRPAVRPGEGLRDR